MTLSIRDSKGRTVGTLDKGMYIPNPVKTDYVTIKQLKEFLDKYDYTDTSEVWIGDNTGLSNVCTKVIALNSRSEKDILLEGNFKFK